MKKKYDFVSLKTNNAPYEEELKAAACHVIESGWYLHGRQTEELEAEIARICHVGSVVACSNGLDALRLIFRAYKELGTMADGDEVIVPANTYIATFLAVSDNNLTPVFAEPSETTMNLDIDRVEALITPRTRAIIVVHLYGTPCWSERLIELAKTYRLKIIEDNAQAIGAAAACNGLHGSRITGGLGDAAGFSFYPTKNVGALGDAGAVATNDAKLAQAVRALANYGSDRRYHNIYRGLNCRIDEIQAALLLVKLRHLPEIIEARRTRADTYNRIIQNPLITKPRIFSDMLQVWHQYEILVADNRRDEFRDFLAANGVATDIHYAVPPHQQPCYAQYAGLNLPVTCRLANSAVSLPITEGTSLEDIDDISAIINAFK